MDRTQNLYQLSFTHGQKLFWSSVFHAKAF
jgi:hypothetical protein